MSTDSDPGPRPRRILVVANETVAARGVVDEVRYRAGDGPAEVVVVAPALARGRLEHWLASDHERRHADAEERLGSSLHALEAAGLNARGHLGDADPLQALDDAMRVFDPDEIVISTHPPARSNWLERRVVQKARGRYPIPVTHVVVDLMVESTRAESDDRRLTDDQGRRLRLFHTSGYDDALEIQADGFRDRSAPGTDGRGVWVSERPPDGSGDDWVVFAVDVPEDTAMAYARGEGPEGRRFLLPADLLNRLGPPVAQGDWSE